MIDNQTTELLCETKRENAILRDKLRIANGTGAKTCVKCGTFLSDELLCTECAIAAWSIELTAEQIHKALFKNSTRIDLGGGNTIFHVDAADLQAIADELNATLESRTCSNQWQWNSGFCCSECFYTVPFIDKFANTPFAHCPNCGRKVAK